MKTTRYFIYFSILLTCSLACQKDESYKDNISLTATREADRNNITLTWSLSYHGNFVKYHLVRSTGSTQSDFSIPQNNIPDSIHIFTFTDQTTTQFTDEEFKPSADLYYKLYIEREDQKVISSPTVKVSGIANTVDIDYAHSAKIPGTTQLLISGLKGKIVKYDYAQDKILNEVNLDDFNFPLLRIEDAGNGLEVFVSSINSKKIYVLDINDLSIKATAFFYFPINDLTCSPKGFLLVAEKNNDTPNKIYLIRRADWAIRDSITNPTTVNVTVKVLPSNDSTLYYFSEFFYNNQTFNNDGIFTGEKGHSNVSPRGDLKKDVSVSPSISHIIFTTKSPVVDPFLNLASIIIDLDSPFHTFENDATVYAYHDELKSLVLYDIFTRAVTVVHSQIRPMAVYRTESQVIALMLNYSSDPFQTKVLVLDK